MADIDKDLLLAVWCDGFKSGAATALYHERPTLTHEQVLAAAETAAHEVTRTTFLRDQVCRSIADRVAGDEDGLRDRVIRVGNEN